MNIREALLAQRREGNRGAFTEKKLIKMGVEQAAIDEFMKAEQLLWHAVRAYTHEKLSPGAKIDALDKLEDRVYDAWKNILSVVGGEFKFKCSEHDAGTLSGFAAKFRNQRNDTSDFTGEEDETYSIKRWMLVTEPTFCKNLETMLGVMIEGATMLTPEEVQFLTEESKIIGKYKATKKELNDITDSIDRLNSDMKKIVKARCKQAKEAGGPIPTEADIINNDPVCQYLAGKIKGLDKVANGYREKMANLSTAFKELHK